MPIGAAALIIVAAMAWFINWSQNRCDRNEEKRIEERYQVTTETGEGER